MTKVAQVIVDLPVKQTNKPFSYSIPDEYQNLDLTGRRVMVDFNHRKLLGFVIEQIETKEDNLKELDVVLDDSPVLSDELLALSEWMSEYFFSYRINSISAILPNQYKVNYLKNYQIIDEVDEDIYKNIFLSLDLIPINSKHISEVQQQKINQLIKGKKVIISTEVSRREKVKTAKAVFLKLDVFDVFELLKQGKKVNSNQKKILEFFLENPDKKITVNQLATNLELSIAVINNLIKKDWLGSDVIEIRNNPIDDIKITPATDLILNSEQKAALDQINAAEHTNQKFLLEGITGSGKTEVYLQAIKNTLHNNQSAIFLVPEITLTSQIVRRVKERFGNLVGILHSDINDSQRLYTWNQIKEGKIKVVVGTRSAIFAPVSNLGLIIVDEEQELSYKQEDMPRYHARDVAKWRSDFHSAPLILGSATPSLETRARATSKGGYKMLKLTERAVKNSKLPQVSVVDMKKVIRQNGGDTDFSSELLSELKSNKQKQKQSILLINRRGYSSFMMCRNCGFVPTDKRCSIALTVHLEDHTLKCHYCGHQESIPSICANCGSTDIRYFGTGTQKVAETLNKLIPDLRISRMDIDTTSKKGAADKIIRDFEDGQYDVLVGTQMVAKGLDFPNVSLVGVINSDTSLNLPDFRANEKTFDLLSQVAGRAGRSDDSGKVILQTFNPEHFAIQTAAAHNYEDFFKREMNYRHAVGYPPYFYTIKVSLSGLEDLKTSTVIENVAKKVLNQADQKIELVGPSSRAINKLKGRFNYQFLIKFKKEGNLTEILEKIQDEFIKDFGREIYLSIDREPLLFN